MKDITVILPIHKIEDLESELFVNALDSVAENIKTYTHGNIKGLIVCPSSLGETKRTIPANWTIINNDGETDFCSQINYAAQKVETDYFSILEFDDEYIPNWFEMAHNYFYGNEDVSVFLPLNINFSEDRKQWFYGNELAWAISFSEEIGFVDEECITNAYESSGNVSGFNLTGGIFNTKDFLAIGGFKPSMEIAFTYEFLLRLVHKKLKVYVVPKEGYKHVVGRKGSLTDFWANGVSEEDAEKWLTLAKQEALIINAIQGGSALDWPVGEDKCEKPGLNE